MNKSELTDWITAPELIGKSQLNALKEVVRDFPYFQGGYVLVAKSLANQKHYEFEKYLHQASLRVPDRQVLFRFIHQEEFVQTEVLVNEPELVENISLPVSPLVEITEVKEEIMAEEPVQEEEPAVDDTVILDSIIRIEKKDYPVAESELITNAIIEPVEEKVVDQNEVPVLIIPDQNEVHTFSEWLKLAGHKPLDKPDSDNILKEEPVREEKKASVEEAEEEKKKEVEDEHKLNSSVNRFESILDKFIKESPRISRPKAEFYSPANMAKQSVEEDEDLVTETLAKLYYNQGHNKKAIRAYEKLCLIYPHKMAYFADLIQKIKLENKD